MVRLLSKDDLAAITEFGGREGFLGKTYLRLYQLQELVSLNFAYEVSTLLPGVMVFGSNGFGEAFAFDLHDSAVIQVPFLPLSEKHLERKAASFCEFIQSLAASGNSLECDPDGVGMEVHAIHPLCLGGSPTDPANRVLVPAAKHAEICRFWNGVHREALARQGSCS